MTTMMIQRFLFVLGASLLVWVGSLAGIGEASQPHIVLVVADDFGWHNAGFHPDGPAPSEEVKTPVLNDLAQDGIVLDRFYSYKICSPARSSLISGRLAVHVNTENSGPESFNPDDTMSGFAGIPRNMTGIASRMREVGYRTHMVGKWDVGMATYDHTPLGRGFESWLGYYHHCNSYWNYGIVWEYNGEINACFNLFTDLTFNNKPGKEFITHPATYEEELFLTRSLQVINEHNTSEPLFLYHAFHIVHTPLQVPQEYLDEFDFIDTKGRRLYASMVFYMDTAVGKLVEALKMNDMWDNTLLWFLSDNGGPIYNPASANNYPLRGGKFSDWEGGVRVNAFVSGGWIPEERRGKVVTDFLHVSDIYTTLFSIGGGVDPTDHRAAAANLPPVDGLDQSGVLLGSASNVRTEIHLSEDALIQGHLKYVQGAQVQTGWTGPFYPNSTGPVPIFQTGWNFTGCIDGCLYDIFKDPTEHHELSKQMPDVVISMRKRLEELNKNNFKPNRGKESFLACIQAVKNGGFYGHFLSSSDLNNPHQAALQNNKTLLMDMVTSFKEKSNQGAVETN